MKHNRTKQGVLGAIRVSPPAVSLNLLPQFGRTLLFLKNLNTSCREMVMKTNLLFFVAVKQKRTEVIDYPNTTFSAMPAIFNIEVLTFWTHDIQPPKQRLLGLRHTRAHTHTCNGKALAVIHSIQQVHSVTTTYFSIANEQNLPPCLTQRSGRQAKGGRSKLDKHNQWRAKSTATPGKEMSGNPIEPSVMN